MSENWMRKMRCFKMEKGMSHKYNKGFTLFSHMILIIASVSCIFPFVLLIMASFTEETTLIRNGYSIFPEKFSLEAYEYIFSQAGTIFRAYGITLIVTVVGTAAGLLITAMLAYTLSQYNLPGGKFMSFVVVFSMLFNGGLVATYLWYTGTLHLKNTILALLVPGLVTNGFLILIATNYFRTNVPQEVVEAARVDGAGEFRIFFTIVTPFSKPILAALGIMQGIGYWNDWKNGLYYLTDPVFFNIQNILNRMIQEISFLSSGDAGGYASDYAGSIPTASVRMAIAVIAVIPIMVIYPFFQEQFAKGLTVGAVKG